MVQNKTALRYLIAQSSGYAIMMIFVTNASFIYQTHFGLSEQIFGLVFALNTIFNVIVNRVNSRMLSTVSALHLLRIALVVQAFFVALLVLFTYFNVPVYIFVIGIIGVVGVLGAIQPNTNALFISQYSEHTGSASALLGSCQFIAGSVMGGLTTLFFNGTLWPIVVIMGVLAIISNVTLARFSTGSPI